MVQDDAGPQRPERILRMHHRRCGIGAGLLIMAAGGLTPTPPVSMAYGSTVQDTGAASIQTRIIGNSAEGRSLRLVTVSADPEHADALPALLIVAGIDATHRTGIEVASSLADRIASSHAALLEDRTVYIVPLLNLDADARRGRGPVGMYDLSHAPKAIDNDRDRRTEEDGPNDLNGDGVITQMRVKNPGPGSGLVATHIPHEDDPRLLRPADRSKGEIPVYALLTEGVDDDGDGRIAEDPVGGIDLTKHFPYLWDEFDPVTGDYPLEVPSARALADWMLERPNIIAVLTYGPHDTLSTIPADGKFDVTRRVPLGIESDDKSAYDKVRSAFLEATGLKNAEGRSNEGSFHGWAYAHLGLYSFSTTLWSLPEELGEEPADSGDSQPKTDGATEPDSAELSLAEIQSMIRIYESGSEQEQAELMKRFNELPADTQARIMAIASGEPDPAPNATAPAAEAGPSDRRSTPKGQVGWLAYADERGEGFVDWQPFDHPQLGQVEIGGFVPGFTLNAPEREIERIADAQAAFIGELLGLFPNLEVGTPTVTSLGSGVYRVGLRITNTGELASRPAIAEKTRRLPPILVRPQIDRKAVLIGDPIGRIERLNPGASEDFVWTLRTSEATLDITITVPESGEQTVTVELREGN